ncbi:membrane protein [Rugosimonospora acidiphila]|uniref:Membrane protein n=1 Tax=Rugosimonospora acidiphila TaxID=556531 RepID=A0ABP9SLE7_9ACTN
MTKIGNSRHPRRLAQLYTGLILYGVSTGLMIQSHLGSMPWDVLHQGIARHTGLAFGWVSIGVGAIVLLFWIPLRQRPGLGTISNVVIIGPVANATLDLLPAPHPIAARAALLVSGIVLNGVAGGLYIGASYGPGPRDGLMTGVAARTGRSIRLVRTGIEVVVVIAGAVLGGVFNVGTVLYALAIGPLVQLFLPLFTTRRPATATDRPDPAAGTAPRAHPTGSDALTADR